MESFPIPQKAFLDLKMDQYYKFEAKSNLDERAGLRFLRLNGTRLGITTKKAEINA